MNKTKPISRPVTRCYVAAYTYLYLAWTNTRLLGSETKPHTNLGMRSSCIALLGVYHSRLQRPRSFWSAPKIVIFGADQTGDENGSRFYVSADTKTRFHKGLTITRLSYTIVTLLILFTQVQYTRTDSVRNFDLQSV